MSVSAKKAVDKFRSPEYSSPVNETCGVEDIKVVPLLGRLLRAAQRVEARVESSLADTGLSLAKLGVLNHLVEAGEPLPLGQLAGRISCVKSNMTQLIDRLETDGLVARVNDPEDRRCVRAAVTEEGRLRQAAGTRILEEQESALVAGLEDEERERFAGILRRLSGE